jgi:OOP family OmpA-OmpF porin
LENYNMRFIKAVGALSLAGFAALNGAVAVADDQPNWYGGLGLGWTKARIDDGRITRGFAGSGLTVDSISDDENGFGYKVFAGRQFNQYFGVEGGYFNLGKFGYTANTTPAGSEQGSIKLQGLNLDAVGTLPVTDKFSVLGRVGVTYLQSRDSFTGAGAVTVSDSNPKKNDVNYKFGVGVQYAFTDALAMRGEVERYRVNDAVGNRGDVDMLSVGLIYRFGGGDKPAARAETPPPKYVAPVAATRVEPAPPAAKPVEKAPVETAAVAAAPVEPAPVQSAAPIPPAPVEAAPIPPAPVVIVVPVAARTQQYCSILDIQFEINEKTVQRESEEKIDKVAIFMRKYPETTAVIEGHSDEVGTTKDNMKLSERRAENVVNYLVDHGGIARSRLKAVGYGETRPIADNKTEEGKRRNRRIDAIIACATDIEGIAVVPNRLTMALEMEFDTNRADVRPRYREELRKVANFMKAHPGVTATVEGHTANQQATAALAMQISQRRAQNVVNYLVDNFGVARSRLTVVGFGRTRRFAYNTSAEGQQENRRINIIFDYPN